MNTAKVENQANLSTPPHREGSVRYEKFDPIYWENKEKRIFFKQTSPTAGSYLECWVGDVGFSHILTSSNLGTPERMAKYIEQMQLKPSSEEEYESLLAHYFQTVDAKRKVFNEHRDRKFAERRAQQ